jgi:hypothetical protein
MGTDLGDESTELPLRRVRGSIDMLTNRITAIETQTAHIPELVKAQKDTNDYLSTLKTYEATVRHLVGKGILLIVSAIGGTYGVTRATAPAPTVEHTVIQKSATAAKVEACTAMQPGPDRDSCAIRILTELMGPQAR